MRRSPAKALLTLLALSVFDGLLLRFNLGFLTIEFSLLLGLLLREFGLLTCNLCRLCCLFFRNLGKSIGFCLACCFGFLFCFLCCVEVRFLSQVERLECNRVHELQFNHRHHHADLGKQVTSPFVFDFAGLLLQFSQSFSLSRRCLFQFLESLFFGRDDRGQLLSNRVHLSPVGQRIGLEFLALGFDGCPHLLE